MRLGIIGKPQSGKTTVFNAASGQEAAVGDFSQASHRAVVKVPDQRLYELAKLFDPKKITHAEVDFLDAPGFTGKGKQGGSLDISPELRQCEALVVIVDSFSQDCTPKADLQNLIDEMILADQVLVESNREKKKKKQKVTGDKSDAREIDLLGICLEKLEQERPLIELDLSDDDAKLLRGYQFLSQKPLLIVVNISESQLDDTGAVQQSYSDLVRPGQLEVIALCGKIEMELAALEPEERKQFLAELGIETAAMDRVIQSAYRLLGQISFLTAGEPEVRAWTIRKGTTAQKSAGVIHSDIERGFIRAEVTSYDDMIEHKTSAALKAAGKQRLEGKEYIVLDGDVILFRFNV
ncbi:MAG: DUF933 domain-containing protein [Candidatus Zixiibacteriota bacterium]